MRLGSCLLLVMFALLQSFVHRGSGVNHSGQLEVKTLISTGVVAAHTIAKGRRKNANTNQRCN